MYREDGEAVWICELNSYGRVRNFQGESKTMCPFRYQGQYEDAETGLYYNRFRYYSPEEGMYISQDPIGLAGNNPTLYGYVKDVNSWVDVLGLDCTKNKKTSYSGKSRRDAFRQAKRDAGIPISQQPNKTYHTDLMEKDPITGKKSKVIDPNTNEPIQTRNYEFINNKGETIIQEHSLGHPIANPGDPGSMPHFNVRPSNNPDIGHVDGTHGHYNF